MSYSKEDKKAFTLLAGIVGVFVIANCFPKRTGVERSLLSITSFYESPRVLVVYSGSETAQNSKPQSSSINKARNLTEICEKNKIPYEFLSLDLEHPSVNPQGNAFLTTIVYCTPTVDIQRARELEQKYEQNSDGKISPESFQYLSPYSRLERINIK